MQAKDIPEKPILAFLASRDRSATHWQGYENSIPANGFPEKVLLAKLRAMIRKGLIDGCACGCRGDFRIK